MSVFTRKTASGVAFFYANWTLAIDFFAMCVDVGRRAGGIDMGAVCAAPPARQVSET